jgi:hypothetical protein
MLDNWVNRYSSETCLYKTIKKEKTMKNLLLAVFIFFLAASVGGSAKEKKREPDVKGGYRECRVYHYEYKDGKLDSGSKQKTIYSKYDENGNEIENISFKSDGSINWNSKYEYNDIGKMKRHISFQENYPYYYIHTFK